MNYNKNSFLGMLFSLLIGSEIIIGFDENGNHKRKLEITE
jgi:hypothetical protein